MFNLTRFEDSFNEIFVFLIIKMKIYNLNRMLLSEKTISPSSKNLLLSILILWALTIPALSSGQSKIMIRGIYGSPQPFWERGIKIADLGVNAVFIHSGSIDHTLIKKAKAEGLKIYAEFPTLNGKNYVNSHPEAWPINQNGVKAEQASWFMGVCPTDIKFRQFRMDQLRKLLQSFDLDGVWMDYVHWHAQFEEPEPILPETCFCNSCLSRFEKSAGIKLPGNTIEEKARWILGNRETEWRNWRCRIIQSWAREIRDIMRKEKPAALLGIYHCPWDDEEFDGARRRILGLDYDMLRDIVDVFSPMVYHGRMGRDPGWVKKNIEWFCDRLKIEKDTYPKVWPIVQAYDDPYKITPSEFETVLNGGMEAGSSGIMMFTSYAVAAQEEKIRVMQKVYLRETK